MTNKTSTTQIGSANDCRFALDFYVFLDEEAWVAYCPALDLSTCAATYNEAVGAFYEMFQLHIETCLETGTLHDDLLSHGWKVRKRDIVPPAFAVLIRKPEMKRLVNGDKSYERIVAPARIPAMA